MKVSIRLFVALGLVLVLAGILQFLTRPRRAGETDAERWVNGATVKATLFVTVGVLGILVGLGLLPIPRFGVG